MILTLPINDDYSAFLEVSEHNDFPHSTSKKFDVLTDDHIDYELDDSGLQQLRKLKFKAIRHHCNDLEFMGFSVSMDMNVLDGIIHLVTLSFKDTNIMTFAQLNEILRDNFGDFVRRAVSSGVTDIFEEFDMGSGQYDNATFLYKCGDVVFCINKSGSPKSTKPLITLTAYTRIGYYSESDFAETYKKRQVDWRREYDEFSKNFSIDGL
ncbi:hypothetical protein [Leclercia sp.]|uniref:hypothetical protein n=1 Tax=Leclercia sp. TaxID=1898428 RepID=UPI002FDD3C3C